MNARVEAPSLSPTPNPVAAEVPIGVAEVPMAVAAAPTSTTAVPT